jgi:HPt (histidine-containing phosphotransfer) domain-containing protein
MSEKLTDLTFMKGLVNNDNVKLAKYITMFLKATPTMLNTIDKSFEEKDWETLRVTAHSLKPQLSYMGIKQLEETIKTIEFNAGQGLNLETMPELIAKLNTDCARAILELEEDLKALS